MSSLLENLSYFSSSIYNSLPSLRQDVREVERVVIREVDRMNSTGARTFLRIAGLSGATAVIMAAYGAHVFNSNTEDVRMKEVFDSGNKLHLIHSVALLGVPLTRKPVLVGTLMTTGILLFSGSCYVHALTGNVRFRKVTPYGGMMLILAWLAMII